jgi:hypothetical protein
MCTDSMHSACPYHVQLLYRCLLDIRSDVELRRRLRLDLLQCCSGHQFLQSHLSCFTVNLEHGLQQNGDQQWSNSSPGTAHQFCNDHADATRSGQGQRALIQDLRVTLLVAVIGDNDDFGCFWV